MKKRNLILILIATLFVTGCSNISYDLNINLNSNSEKLYFNHSDKEETESLINQNIDYIPHLSDKGITHEVTNTRAEIIYNFDDIKKIKQSDAIAMLYNNVEVTLSNGITTIKMSDYNNSSFVCGEFDDDCSMVLDGVTFNLKSEYEIVSSNADKIDKSNNKYTWYFDEKDKGAIYFSYSDKIRWDIVIKNYIRNNKGLISILSIVTVLTIAIIIFVYKFMKTMKENNS